MKVGVRVPGAWLARVAPRAGVGKHRPASRDRIGSELLIELGDELSLRAKSARPVQLSRAAGHQEVDDVRQPVLDGTEVRAVAPALADVERGLSEAAVLGIGLPQIGDVIDPALFGAGPDV